MHKISPSYLFQLIPLDNNIYATRSSQSNKISSFKTRHNFFKDSFFPVVISEWNSLNINIRNSSSIDVFKKELLKYIRPEPNSTYNVNDTKGLKLLKITDIETTTHFPLHCPNHHCARKTLFHKINQVSGTILRQSDSTITKILLFGDNKLDFETKKILLTSTIEFVSLAETFCCPLFE